MSRPWIDRVPEQQRARVQASEASGSRENGSCGLLEVFSTEEEESMAGRKRHPDGKRTRELLRQLPPGYTIEKAGRTGHPAVLKPDGEPLRDERGLPVCVTGTGSSATNAYDLARIRRAIRRAS